MFSKLSAAICCLGESSWNHFCACVSGHNMHYSSPEFTPDANMFGNSGMGGGTVFFNMPYMDDATMKDYVKKQM